MPHVMGLMLNGAPWLSWRLHEPIVTPRVDAGVDSIKVMSLKFMGGGRILQGGDLVSLQTLSLSHCVVPMGAFSGMRVLPWSHPRHHLGDLFTSASGWRAFCQSGDKGQSAGGVGGRGGVGPATVMRLPAFSCPPTSHFLPYTVHVRFMQRRQCPKQALAFLTWPTLHAVSKSGPIH